MSPVGALVCVVVLAFVAYGAIASLTAAGLTLWRVGGPVRVAELTELESPSGLCLRVPS